MKKVTSTIVKEFDKDGKLIKQTETTVTETNETYNPYAHIKPFNFGTLS